MANRGVKCLISKSAVSVQDIQDKGVSRSIEFGLQPKPDLLSLSKDPQDDETTPGTKCLFQHDREPLNYEHPSDPEKDIRLVKCSCNQGPNLSNLISYQTPLRLTTKAPKAIRVHELPPELIFSITEYLETPALNALRMTCRQFYRIVPGVSLCGVHIVQFKDLVQRDRYTEFVCQERNDLSWRRLLGCSACRELHYRCFFSPVQKLLDPSQRICYGAQGYLRVCPHVALSLKDFRARAYKEDGSTQALNDWLSICPTCLGDRPWEEYRNVYMILRPSDCLPIYGTPHDVELVRVFTILRSSRCPAFQTEAAFETEVIEALSKLDIRVCPHIASRDSVAWSHMDLPAAENLPGCHGPARSTAMPLMFHPLRGSESRRGLLEGRCKVLDCRTTLMLDLVPPRASHLIVKIVTKLGDLKDATDPMWLRRLTFPIEDEVSRKKTGIVVE